MVALCFRGWGGFFGGGGGSDGEVSFNACSKDFLYGFSAPLESVCRESPQRERANGWEPKCRDLPIEWVGVGVV